MREESTVHECTNRKCKWRGTNEEKLKKPADAIRTDLVCPDCGNDNFFRLLDSWVEMQKNKKQSVIGDC